MPSHNPATPVFLSTPGRPSGLLRGSAAAQRRGAQARTIVQLLFTQYFHHAGVGRLERKTYALPPSYHRRRRARRKYTLRLTSRPPAPKALFISGAGKVSQTFKLSSKNFGKKSENFSKIKKKITNIFCQTGFNKIILFNPPAHG